MTKFRMLAAITAVGTLVALVAFQGTSQAGPRGRFGYHAKPGQPPLSGVADPRTLKGNAGVRAPANAPRVKPAFSGDDIQVNGDNKVHETDQFGTGIGQPQNETAIAINPNDATNVIAAANDYEPGADTIQGIYTSFDGGHTWRSRHLPDNRNDNFQIYASGDPSTAWDSAGEAYSGYISFGRANCDSFVAVSRSDDNGVDWTVPAAQVSAGLLITPGDGIVAHNGGPNDCEFFNDKPDIATGPRPQGAPLVPGTDQNHLSPDRLYAVWTLYDFGPGGTGFVNAPIVVSYSDDQGRHWSDHQVITGSSAICKGKCDNDQNAHPVVDQGTGEIWVAFENYNNTTSIRNHFLIVRSTDGGQTWVNPREIAAPVDGFSLYPNCFGDETLDQMCARVDLHTSNIDEDQNNGTLYAVWSDNRNGTASNTNEDVFVKKSTDGGITWGNVRNITGKSTDDQFYPWLSVTPDGTVAVAYFDRRYNDVGDPGLGGKLIDTSLSVSTNLGNTFATTRVSDVSWNPDLVFRLGFFIGDYNGLDTVDGTALPFWTDGRFAEPNVDGNNPPNQQSDVMTDVESIATRCTCPG